MSDTSEALNKISDQIKDINDQQIIQNEQHKQIKEKLDVTHDTVKTFIEGNGHPGAKVRIDRLEQDKKTKSKWLSFLGIAVIGVVIKSLWEAMT